MTTSILLRPPQLASPSSSPSPSPSPVSTPLPALQPDLSSSSSSTSGSYLDLHRASSAPSTRRIRFAPLPEPNRDSDLFHLHDLPQSDTKPATQPVPALDDSPDGSLALSPSASPDSTLSSIRSTPTIRLPSKNTQKPNLKLLRPFSFLRRANSSSTHSASLPSSRNPSLSSLPQSHSSSSVPNSPSLHSAKLPRISEDLFSFRGKSLFRARSGSSCGSHPPRTSSPPPKHSDPSKFLHRSASTGSGPAMKLLDGKRDRGEHSRQSHDSAAIAGSGAKKRRASSSALTPGAGGGRHTSVKVHPNDSPVRPSTAPSSLPAPKKHVKMLNGRVYGAKRYAAQTLANPFANVRDEPEFVEWGYGGMGSVQASAGIANDMWKGLQRSERGGALFAGSSLGSPSASAHHNAGIVTAGGGRGSGACATSPTVRRKMSTSVPECGMGNVYSTGMDEDDGSGIAWLKRRRAEREAKARVEHEAKELERKTQEKRKSTDSMDASMYASTASTTTSLTACTSVASTDLTSPTTSPLTSRSPSMTDLRLTSLPSSGPRDLRSAPSSTVTGAQSSDATHPGSASKDDHEHHVLTAVRLSPNISSLSHKHERVPSSPVDKETTTSTNSSSDDDDEDDDDDDDDEHEAQDVGRKTALGAGVEKISRHADAKAP